MRKGRRHKAGHPNHERWLITYSDLITLLLIFFVIMYAMSKIDVAKFLTLSESLNAAFNPSNQIPLPGLGKTALLQVENPSSGHQQSFTIKVASKAQQVQLQNVLREDAVFSQLYQELQQYVDHHQLAGQLSLANQARGIQITLTDVVLFRTGSDRLRPQALNILADLMPFLQSVPNNITVEGFTDNVPIRTAKFPSNWELSAGRAVNVVRFLIAKGINPTRLSATGYGRYRPIVPNNSAAHRQMNRRVNIVILHSSISAEVLPSSYLGTGSSGSLATTPKLGFNPHTVMTHNLQQSKSLPNFPSNVFATSHSSP